MVRFDALFDLDRFGTVFQRLQAGCKKGSAGDGDGDGDVQCGSIRNG
jgi:hypothetical protein